jgi:nucleotide-binding universal stress UspA family protein
MKILLAIDGSTCSDEAIEGIARRPWPVGSEVKVLTAFELSLPPTPETWALPPGYLDEMDRAARQHAQSIVERAVEKLKSKLDAVVVHGEFLPGPARIVILDEAESWGADLIIVGSHGYRAWERFLLGSVSQSVVSHAKCSVEVVRCPNGHRDATKEPTTSKEKEQ